MGLYGTFNGSIFTFSIASDKDFAHILAAAVYILQCGFNAPK